MIVIAPGLRLRVEEPADLDFARAVYGEGRAAELALVPWSEAAKCAFLDDQFRLQLVHFSRVFPHADRWIVERERRAIGRMYIDRQAATWRFIEIGLVSAAQGRGTGARLIGWLTDSARAAGAAAIDLHVARDNARATALYRRLGFVQTETGATHVAMRLTLS